MWNGDSVKQLEAAVDTYDGATAEMICSALLDQLAADLQPPPLPIATAVLRALRRKRQFGLLRRVASALLESGLRDAIVRRQYAQALIEHGELGGALDVLDRLIKECAREPDEIVEAHGLIGRVHKQRYVAGAAGALTDARRQALDLAVKSYWKGYQIDTARNTWHGVNAASLCKRAARDGVALSVAIDADAVARDLLAVLEKGFAEAAKGLPAYDLATAAEACWVLGRRADALDWVRRYLADDAGADAFEVAGTLRQMREIWQLREDGDGGDMVAILSAARLAREGGSRQLGQESAGPGGAAQAASTRSAFEKTFSPDSIVTYDWYRMADGRARAVGRVEDPSRKGFGTGFLLPASLMFDGAAPGAQLFLTNAHVVSDSVSNALRPHRARVCFQAWNDGTLFRIAQLLWESPPDQLDAALVRLDAPVDVPPLELALPEPLPTFVEKERRRFYAIGYPKGGRLALSIDDNLQVGWQRPKLHYRTPTEPGSSGSPMFDRDWELVALHHSGRSDMPRLDGKPGTYEANEGIWIHDIITAARAALAARG